MIDRIDFKVDVMQAGVPCLMTMVCLPKNDGTTRPIQYIERTDEGCVFRFPEVKGFRAIGYYRPEIMTTGMNGQPLNPPVTAVEGDPQFYTVEKIVINPWMFPDILTASAFVHTAMSFLRGDPKDGLPWGLRVTRIELAVDLPLEFEHVFHRVFIPNIRTRQFQREDSAQKSEVVWGAPPICLASYNRKERLEMLKLPTENGPLTRLERRYTESWRWRKDKDTEANMLKFPQREIQSMDWLTNMCADIEEGIFQPFQGVELMNLTLPDTTPEIQTAERALLRARTVREKRRLLPVYREALSRLVEVRTMLHENGYLWTHQCINRRYGPRNQTTGNHALLSAYQNLLESFVTSDGERIQLGELLKESIRQHHFKGQAPERVNIPPVPPRWWIQDRTVSEELNNAWYVGE